MIGINFSEFFFGVLTVASAYILFLWSRELARQKHNDWRLSNRRLFHCNSCHYTFVPKYPVTLCRCPNCNTVCIRRGSDLIPARRHEGRE